MSTINLSKVDELMHEADAIIARLDGVNLDERIGSKADSRETRVERSRDLQRLAQIFELCAALTLHEYWVARGGSDPIYHRSQA